MECRDGETLLSQNRTLAPLSMVEVSDDISVGRATNVYNFGYDGDSIDTWCTDNNDLDLRLELGFTSPILITTMISSGTIIGSRMFYVTNFTLEYSLSNTSNYTYYTDENNNRKVNKLFKLYTIDIESTLRFLSYTVHYPMCSTLKHQNSTPSSNLSRRC